MRLFIYAIRVACWEFRAVMQGRPASKDRIPYFEGWLDASVDDFRHVQEIMFRYREALDKIDDDTARAALLRT